MIVRERLAKKADKIRLKKQNQTDLAKGKRIDKKADDGLKKDVVR